MRSEVKKEIDGENYCFTIMNPTESLDCLTELGNIFGDSLAKIFASIDKELQNIDLNIATGAIPILFSKMKDSKFSDIIKRFMKTVIHEGGKDSKPLGPLVKGIFEIHFQGRLFHMFKVFIACGEVQYSDFLEGFGGIQGFLQHLATMSGKQISKAGNGSSGDQL